MYIYIALHYDDWYFDCSVLGGVLMIGGLYSVLWGKGKEDVVCKSMNEDVKNSIEERGATSPFHPV